MVGRFKVGELKSLISVRVLRDFRLKIKSVTWNII